MSYKIKPWEELTIQDDYMFKLIMRRKRICKKMLEKILQIEIRDIKYLENEKTIEASYNSKGIRLDVYVADEYDTVFNVDYSEFPVIPSFTSTYLSLLALDVKHRNNISAIA